LPSIFDLAPPPSPPWCVFEVQKFLLVILEESLTPARFVSTTPGRFSPRKKSAPGACSGLVLPSPSPPPVDQSDLVLPPPPPPTFFYVNFCLWSWFVLPGPLE